MKSRFDSIESVITDIRKGKMVIVVDDADRENEGDLIMAAQYVTPAAINFMAKLYSQLRKPAVKALFSAPNSWRSLNR